MRILLDTSAYSAFKQGHPGAVGYVRKSNKIFLNSVVLGELLAGFSRGQRNAQNRAELREFLESPRLSVLHIDAETAERYAVLLCSLLEKGKPVPTNDIWIAASAMQHGLRLVTADAHFKAIEHVMTELLEG